MGTLLKFYHHNKEFFNDDAFCADHEDLDRYLSTLMGQHETNNISRHYAGLNEENKVMAMFCITASEIRVDDPNDTDRSTVNLPPRMNWPTVRIGRLAVHKDHRGEGFGFQSLAKAVELFIKISKLVGVVALTVDAKDETNQSDTGPQPLYLFYEKFGFKKLTNSPINGSYPMVMYLSSIKKYYPSLFETPV